MYGNACCCYSNNDENNIQNEIGNMNFTNINLYKSGNNAMKAAFGYAGGHHGDLKKGSLLMTSQFSRLLNNPRPFFILFDEFHLKKIPAWRFQSWKAMVVAIATFDGHIQMVCLNLCKCFF